MLEMDKFDAIQISLASPEKIRSWSFGEVKKPETINYRTHKPERDGLFCERIFGPTKDWECFCGKYKSIRYRGIICERCNVEITRAAVRRERMGHIQLVTPVAHIWYSKGSPSYIALLLDISARDLEKVLYFQQYIVIDPGNLPLSKKQLLPEEGSGGEMGYRELREKYGDMFVAKMGAEAIKELLAEIDLKRLEAELSLQLKSATGSKRAHLLKRLDLVKMYARSVSRPEWMILDVLPVIPPDLRPMVQLDGGRFATSDLNDLYRRVINRNNRLKRLIKLQAPEIIIKNEKRMLQEAVNALIDNGRRGKLVTGPNNRPLKSLTDMLKGKQGRFRQNLLGKRVDYSGRSVIVVGPQLKLHQAGLPKKMALELFKPFVMHRLVSKGIAFNIKNAKKLIEREKSEVWDVLEEVIRHHPILLNRAPTLHRLGIQAFEPVLIEGKAIQIHPLVCVAYNADFDGDQMAVHVPLMLDAQIEARMLMLASNNILKPADGKPIVTPTQDMTIGIFYLTCEVTEPKNYFSRTLTVANEKQWAKLLTENRSGIPLRLAEPVLDKDGKVAIEARTELAGKEIIDQLKQHGVKTLQVLEPPVFMSFDEAINAYQTRQLDLQWPVYVHRSAFPEHSLADLAGKAKGSGFFRTTVGRIIFNTALPLGPEMQFNNNHIRKADVGALIQDLYNRFPLQRVGQALDHLKELGFRFATLSGLTISMVDLVDPPKKREILAQAERKAQAVLDRFRREEISRDERTQQEIDIWIRATEEVTDDLLEEFKKSSVTGEYNPVYMMAYSGARGNMQQIRQLAAMRGLMSNPHGDILPFPIKSNFREGLNQTEYFISTYGARKGLVDTALRTADSGYLTRRLVDVAQDVVVTIDDCETRDGIVVHPIRKARTSNNILVDDVMVPIRYKISGRVLARDIINVETGKVLEIVDKTGRKVKLEANTYIDEDLAGAVESGIEVFLPIGKVEVGMIAGEQLIDPKSNRIILRPDREINEYVLKRAKDCGLTEIKVRSSIVLRSPLTCKAKTGICCRCYGSDLATTKPVDVGEAVGIIAAQSIGEPGTQLTMRTFHLGGVALAQRSYIKAKVGGKVTLAQLKFVEVSDRSKFEIGSGTETFDKTEYDANVRNVVVGGQMVIMTRDGKKERVHIPVGSELPKNIREGAQVSPGTPLAEFNPNHIVAGVSGEIFFDNIEIKDGIVVSEGGKITVLTQEFDPETYEFVKVDYPIPQGANLRVENNEIFHAGNVLAEMAIETRAAISRIKGIVHFENIRVKNKQVISDRGMIFVFPKDGGKKGKDYQEYKLPKSVKETKDVCLKSGGLVLNVKNGDMVFPEDKLLSAISEIDGRVSVSHSKKTIDVSREVIEDHLLQGEISAKIDETTRQLVLLAPIGGAVRVMHDKSAANKTLDRRKVIIKNEIEYLVPRGVILRPKEHFKVQNGEEVEAGAELTTPLTIQAEIDGTVEIVKIKGERAVHLIRDDLTVLAGGTLARNLINRDTGEEYAREGVAIDDTLLEIIEKNRYTIREVWITAGECRAVRVRGEDHHIDYPVESGTIRVEDGQNVKAGDRLVTDVTPLISEISGKVNYIYNYNKTICEDIIEKVLIYSGIEFSYPASLSLKFHDQVEKDGELITEPIVFEEYEQLDADTPSGGGLLVRKRVKHEKKYRLTAEMFEEGCLLVNDGDEVREGKALAVLKSRNQGVVLLDRKESKEGKSRNTVERIVVQAGEAYQIMDGAELRVEDGQVVNEGEILAKWGFASKKTTDIIQGLPRVAELFEVRRPKKEAVVGEKEGIIRFVGNTIEIEDLQGVVTPIRHQFGMTGLVVHDGEYVEAGDPITEGKIFPKKMAKIVDLTAVQRYLVDEVQRVYRDQGVTINDKHIEIIVRQMLRKRQIVDPGDSEWLPNDVVHVKQFEERNRALLDGGKRTASGIAVIQGITKASLTTDSFISAASFQETTRVLTKAAIRSKVDRLRGLKENLIIGKLIPAGTGVAIRRKVLFKNLPVEITEGTERSEELFLSTAEADGGIDDAAEEELLIPGGSEGALDDGDTETDS